MNQNERICHEKTPQGIQTALDSLAMNKPSLSSLAQAFGPVLVAKAEVTACLSENQVNIPDIPESEWVRFSKGVHLFAITGLMDFCREFKQAAHMILPPLAEAFPDIGSDIEAIHRNIEDDSLDADDCVQAFVTNYSGNLSALALQSVTSPDIFRFALAQIAEPFKQLQARAFAPLLKEHPWPHGHCPMCGSFPAVAGLMDDGEQTWLQCSVCAHEWHFRAHTCPRCENNNQRTIESIVDQNSPARDTERVDACQVCNSYLLTIDLTRQTDSVNMDVAAMGMMGLEDLAQKKGFAPQAQMLWNQKE
ncbi:formate dehydrogenase accessory protein FdhE [uncultured Desulfobacter sp.]|uniref:formate dehydrogenase accessory protein FdhE n=1 Tax=uncultured Desulfobacter sp. TaxID=240139 RepID=UPI002AABA49C|nr:formate dehydrogenase accessory protein FdhE [uncultured Desulfobacter sp.]